MSFKVSLTEAFERMLKPIAKQHPDVFSVLQDLIDRLEQSPKEGTPIGKSCYKIRIPLGNKGKRGGGRVITYVVVHQEQVLLIAIYTKNTQATLTAKELEELLKNLR